MGRLHRSASSKGTRSQLGVSTYLNRSIKELVFAAWDSGLMVVHVVTSSTAFRCIPSTVISALSYPLTLAFHFYVRWPINFVTFCGNFVLAVCLALSRQSTHTRQIAIHVAALSSSLRPILESIINVKISELLLQLLHAIFEVFSSWTSSENRSHKEQKLSIRELTDLLAYEELDNDVAELDHAAQRRMRQTMHHYVPSNPFRAVTKAPHAQSNGGVDDLGSAEAEDVDSPASFPPTPFSRARVMSHSTERVVSTMFAARDRLRVEAQSASRDEYSRRAAMEAQTSGHMAVFDPRQTSDGLALTCGNHCALKVGRGLCCSSRAMIPIRPNTFVYLEFSVTAQSGQVPSLALGLAPAECPLNVMVGSWPGSIGVHSDGQLLVGSRWFEALASSIEAGSTVGILVFLPGVSEHEGLGQSQAQAVMGKNARPATVTAVAVARPSSAVKVTTTCSADEPNKPPHPSASATAISSPLSLNSSFSSTWATAAASAAEAAASVIGEAPLQVQTEGVLAQDRPKKPLSSSSPESSVPTPFVLSLTVNGKPTALTAEASDAASVVIAARSHGPLYPTISLISQDTRVWCRFCEADIVYRSRAALGAPPRARVYCLDGSLLLDESS